MIGYSIALVFGSWATVTTIMLWPVGKSLGATYRSYRTGWFLIGVASMVGIPLFGYMIIASNDPVAKYASLIGLAVDIGVWGIPLCTRTAFCRPIPMLFRPDLLFGDGRLLAGGMAGMGLGMVSIFGPGGLAPKGNWYALFSVIILALVQLIPLRGMWKMRNRISRLLFDKWKGYWAVVAKESYLLAAVVGLMFSFHNFFGGVTPFTKNVLAGSGEGLAIMIAAGLFTVLVRAWYKKYKVGDPFIVESFGQSLVKHGILGAGLLVFLYGFLNVMMGGFPRMPNSETYLYQTGIGLAVLAWGLILMVPVRAWAQSNQRRAMHRQMVEVILPRLSDDLRTKAMNSVIGAVSQLPEKRRLGIVADMVSFLGEMKDTDREKVMKTQLEVLSSLGPDKRIAMMKAMDSAMGGSRP